MKDDMQFGAHGGDQRRARKSLKSTDNARADIDDYNDYDGAQQCDQQSPRSRRKSPSPQPAKENSSSDEEDEERRQKTEDRRPEVLCKLNCWTFWFRMVN